MRRLSTLPAVQTLGLRFDIGIHRVKLRLLLAVPHTFALRAHCDSLRVPVPPLPRKLSAVDFYPFPAPPHPAQLRHTLPSAAA